MRDPHYKSLGAAKRKTDVRLDHSHQLAIGQLDVEGGDLPRAANDPLSVPHRAAEACDGLAQTLEERVVELVAEDPPENFSNHLFFALSRQRRRGTVRRIETLDATSLSKNLDGQLAERSARAKLILREGDLSCCILEGFDSDGRRPAIDSCCELPELEVGTEPSARVEVAVLIGNLLQPHEDSLFRLMPVLPQDCKEPMQVSFQLQERSTVVHSLFDERILLLDVELTRHCGQCDA